MTKEDSSILVVDDEENITELVSMALRYEGFEVRTALRGRDALDAVEAQPPDLIVLDVMLPDMDGFEIAKRIAAAGHRIPVLFLTARDTTEDKVHGLTVGGGDYMTKPFSLEELVVRVRLILRRGKAAPDAAEANRISLGDLVIDEDAREVRRAGDLIELTATEYRLLRYLLVNAGRVLTRAQILDHVWRYDFGGSGSVLETYISYLRRKVDGGHEPLLHTVRGVGYVLREPGRR